MKTEHYPAQDVKPLGEIIPNTKCWCCGHGPLTAGQVLIADMYANAIEARTEAANRGLKIEKDSK